MQVQEEIKVEHKDRCSGVPIKKRLFQLSQCSFSPSQETCSTPHNFRRQPNQFSVEPESSVSVNDAALPLDTGTSPKDFVNSSSASSGQRYGSDVHANHDDKELKKATSAFEGSNMEEDLNADNRPSLGLDMDKGKQLSQPGTWEMIIVDKTTEEKIPTCDVSAFRGVETTSSVHLSSSKANKYHGYNSSKQEIVKTCSLDLHQTMHNEVDSEYGSADCCVSRENWDLNVPMEVWDANLSDSVVEHANLNQSTMHLQNIDRCLIQPTLGTIGSASTSGTSMVNKSQYNPRLTNLRTPADDKRGYEGGLDLQLRPPSRPELRINWGKIAPSDLSLSLTGNLSEVSRRVVKPEHCENSNQKVTEVSQNCSLKSVGIRHIKSEPCDESVHGEASGVAVLFDQESSLGRVLKSEPPEEPKEKPPSLESDDNRQLTSCCTDITPSKVKPSLNSNAVVDANILNDNNPVMPGNAKIKSGESTSRALDPAEVSGSDVPYEADDVLTNICTNQGAEGNTSKSLDIIADPITSDAKESNANMTEIREIADVASALHHESASCLKEEPMAHDDTSEGSAEMDCSDNEDYTSSKLVAGDDLHMATDINNVPSAANQEGLDLPTEIQTEQFNCNEQQLDATYNLRFTTDITRPADGDVEVKGGELGDPVPQCASEVSCDHEEKRVWGNVLECSNELPCENEKKVHENVTTDFAGSDGHPVMMEKLSDTKGKQIAFEEAMSLHRAESFDVSMCRDKKETSSDLTTVLHEPPDNGVVRVSSSKRLAKPCPEAIKNHLGKEKGSEMKSNSIRPPNAIAKTIEDNVDGQQMRTRCAIVSIKHPELPERDSDVRGVGNKHVDDAGMHSHQNNVDIRCKHRRITKVSSPTVRSFGQRKPISSRSISSGTEEGSIDKQRRDRMFSQRRRHSGFESTKNQDQPTDKCDSDYTNTGRHCNRHLDRNSNTRYASEHNNSRKHQFSRLSKKSEVPLEVATNSSVGSASALSRRPMDDQPYRSSCFPLWRRLPRHPEEPPLVDTRNARCLARDISPNREITRTVHHEMADGILYSHPTMQYGPTENDVMPRGSNISPTRRRPPPLHFYGVRSPRRWPSPGRSPEMVMNKHPALVRHGAPPSVDMSSSPHGHLYFPEGTMVERNALPAGMDEMLPVNDHDLPRPGGFLQRNTRRYDFGAHETAADYVGPAHFFADHFVDTRNHHDGRDNHEQTTLPYHVEDARHIRSSRDFDGHARDRLGNTRNRLRSIVEQGEGHRCRGDQGWRDDGLHGERLKKRKP